MWLSSNRAASIGLDRDRGLAKSKLGHGQEKAKLLSIFLASKVVYFDVGGGILGLGRSTMDEIYDLLKWV